MKERRPIMCVEISIMILGCIILPLGAVGDIQAISTELSTDRDTYYANSVIPLTFSLVNDGSEPVFLPLTAPFAHADKGFYLEVSSGAAEYTTHDSGWHEFSTLEPEQTRKMRIDPAERVEWRVDLPRERGNPVCGLDPGNYRLRARFIDGDLDLVSAEITVHIVAPPKEDEIIRQLLRNPTKSSGEDLFTLIAERPESVYAPDILARMAMAKATGAMGLPEQHVLFQERVERALACQELLRTHYPDHPLQRRALLTEAALRLKLGEIAEALTALDLLSEKFPESEEAKKARCQSPG
jgi:hypothetical protein